MENKRLNYILTTLNELERLRRQIYVGTLLFMQYKKFQRKFLFVKQKKEQQKKCRFVKHIFQYILEAFVFHF